MAHHVKSIVATWAQPHNKWVRSPGEESSLKALWNFQLQTQREDQGRHALFQHNNKYRHLY